MMNKCWFSQVLALSALYSVLTTSEQLLSDEFNSRYQIPEGQLYHHSEHFENNGASLPFFDYDQDVESRHSALGNANNLPLVELTEAVEQNNKLSLSDLLEILNDSMGSGLINQDVKFFESVDDYVTESTVEQDLPSEVESPAGNDLNLGSTDTIFEADFKAEVASEYSIPQLIYLERALKAMQAMQSNGESSQELVLGRYLDGMLEELEEVISADSTSKIISLTMDDSQVSLESEPIQSNQQSDDVSQEDTADFKNDSPDQDSETSETKSREQKLMRQRTIAKKNKKEKRQLEESHTSVLSWFAALTMLFSFAAFLS